MQSDCFVFSVLLRATLFSVILIAVIDTSLRYPTSGCASRLAYLRYSTAVVHCQELSEMDLMEFTIVCKDLGSRMLSDVYQPTYTVSADHALSYPLVMQYNKPQYDPSVPLGFPASGHPTVADIPPVSLNPTALIPDATPRVHALEQIKPSCADDVERLPLTYPNV